MNDIPLVSIVTPCYNAELFIEETIKSVLAQTCKRWEMIVVDDGSIDQSLEIVRAYASKDSRIKLIINDINKGAANSRNVAIKSARGRYIAFLDSDDVWHPKKLEKQLALMRNKNVSMSYTAYYTIDKHRRFTALHPVEEKVSYGKLLKNPSMIGTLTMIYDTQKFGKIFFKQMGHEDYIVKLEILKNIDFAVGINEPLAQYRIHQNSLSSNKIAAAKWVWDIYRQSEKLSLPRSLFCFSHYIYYSLTKYKKP